MASRTSRFGAMGLGVLHNPAFGLVLVAVKWLETRIYTLAQGEEKDQ